MDTRDILIGSAHSVSCLWESGKSQLIMLEQNN